MMEVVVGVVLTAVIGGLLVPAVQAHMYQRRERFRMSGELLETLAACLWTYWKLALRVAYYAKKGSTFKDDYATALTAWDSAEAWDNGARIQIQISRSKRLLPEDIHKKLDQLQQQVVDDLDKWVEDLREGGDAAKWENLYECLYGPKRAKIQRLLFSLTQDLARARAGEAMADPVVAARGLGRDRGPHGPRHEAGRGLPAASRSARRKPGGGVGAADGRSGGPLGTAFAPTGTHPPPDSGVCRSHLPDGSGRTSP
jgi:hypothetical protein